MAKHMMLLSKLRGILVLSFPVSVLIVAMLRSGGTPQPILAGGVAGCAFLALGLLHHVGAARASTHQSASPIYLIAVLILWMTTRDYDNWFTQAAIGMLLAIPVTLFVFQELLFSGRGGARRARHLVRRLAQKSDWPEDLAECKMLPEVKALREALREDAEPVMLLLMHPAPQVPLAALEFRPTWRKSQAETVLQAARFAKEPPVRAAALMALANFDDPEFAPALAAYLRDASREVRRAAAEAVLWDADGRWQHIRRELRSALADPRCLGDGPLPISGSLPNLAIADLTTWCGETGPMGRRATLTLMAHYRRELNLNSTPELVSHLAVRIRDSKVPSTLRVEIAHLLAKNDCVAPQLWSSLLDPGQPSALRLLAAGGILRGGPDERALDTLRDMASVPNREIAMQVAAIIQECLRIDMGLPLGIRPPEPTSKLAAEIARRVIDWAAGKTQLPVAEFRPRRTRLTSLARQIPRPNDESPRRRI
jgi:hypothetical protein